MAFLNDRNEQEKVTDFFLDGVKRLSAMLEKSGKTEDIHKIRANEFRQIFGKMNREKFDIMINSVIASDKVFPCISELKGRFGYLIDDFKHQQAGNNSAAAYWYNDNINENKNPIYPMSIYRLAVNRLVDDCMNEIYPKKRGGLTASDEITIAYNNGWIDLYFDKYLHETAIRQNTPIIDQQMVK